MRSNWKYVKGFTMDNGQRTMDNGQLTMNNGRWIVRNCLLSIIHYPLLFCFLFILFSCNSKQEPKHIPSSKIKNLDGLVQPATQTVFSDVKTFAPSEMSLKPEVNVTGEIAYDPGLLNNISSRFSGRIEKLYVRFNFENISVGQKIMDIYSPEILTEQNNFIYLLGNSENNENLVSSSQQKLNLLGLTNEQINQIKITHKPINPLPVFSPYSGHIHDIGISSNGSSVGSMSSGLNSVMNSSASTSAQVQIENLPSSNSSALSIKEGMYLQTGQPVFSVYNISRVWAVLNIYPKDVALIKAGDKVAITAESNPLKTIYEVISYIEPLVGQNASAIKARVYINNADNLHMKIGTLISAKISSAEIKGLWLPRSAVLDLGQKRLVFLKTGNHFETKFIQSGIVTDSFVQIVSGLQDNEQVAVDAQYMVDSESFLELKNNEEK